MILKSRAGGSGTDVVNELVGGACRWVVVVVVVGLLVF